MLVESSRVLLNIINNRIHQDAHVHPNTTLPLNDLKIGIIYNLTIKLFIV